MSRRTVGKWVQRYRHGGLAALEDRSSRPGAPAHQTPDATVALIRQLRETHGLPAWALGRALGVPRSTVSAWLQRLALNRPSVEPPAPVQRYEWPAAGDMIHLDIKRLGRFHQAGHRVHGDRQRCSPGAGWEYVHVAIDDHTRLAYVEVLAAQDGLACAGFLARAIAWYQARDIPCRRLLTDNGSGYLSRAFREGCRRSVCGIGARGPTRHGPTARPSASSRRCSASGPTPCPTRRLRSAGGRSAPGCGTTTASAHTPVSAISRRSPGCRELPDEQRV